MAGVFFTISVGTVSGKLRPGMHVVPGLFPPIRSVRCLKGPQRAPAACIRLRGPQKTPPEIPYQNLRGLSQAGATILS